MLKFVLNMSTFKVIAVLITHNSQHTIQSIITWIGWVGRNLSDGIYLSIIWDRSFNFQSADKQARKVTIGNICHKLPLPLLYLASTRIYFLVNSAIIHR